MKRKYICLPLILSSILMSSCGQPAQTETAAATTAAQTSGTAQTTAAETVTAEPETAAPSFVNTPDIAENSVFTALTEGSMPDAYEASDGWTNGDPFNVSWYSSNVTFNDGKMQLIIDNDEHPKKGIPYSGGELRSKDFYGYGRYEVSMKAIKNDGVVSSFFTYTGPSDSNPWDEIDVEVLGKDTTKVQFNYYTDGKGGHEYMYDLGFDASEDFHTYAFEWSETGITWYVDGKEAHKAEKRLPVTPGKIMANAWCGKGVDGWLNAFTDEKLPLTAEYEWIMFTPES